MSSLCLTPPLLRMCVDLEIFSIIFFLKIGDCHLYVISGRTALLLLLYCHRCLWTVHSTHVFFHWRLVGLCLSSNRQGFGFSLDSYQFQRYENVIGYVIMSCLFSKLTQNLIVEDSAVVLASFRIKLITGRRILFHYSFGSRQGQFIQLVGSESGSISRTDIHLQDDEIITQDSRAKAAILKVSTMWYIFKVLFLNYICFVI